MATEFKDGTFSETKPLPEAFKEFMKAVDSDTARALHVGTPEEIEHVRQEKDAEAELADLQKRVKAIEAEKDGPIHVPTWEEVNKVLGHES